MRKTNFACVSKWHIRSMFARKLNLIFEAFPFVQKMSAIWHFLSLISLWLHCLLTFILPLINQKKKIDYAITFARSFNALGAHDKHFAIQASISTFFQKKKTAIWVKRNWDFFFTQKERKPRRMAQYREIFVCAGWFFFFLSLSRRNNNRQRNTFVNLQNWMGERHIRRCKGAKRISDVIMREIITKETGNVAIVCRDIINHLPLIQWAWNSFLFILNTVEDVTHFLNTLKVSKEKKRRNQMNIGFARIKLMRW